MADIKTKYVWHLFLAQADGTVKFLQENSTQAYSEDAVKDPKQMGKYPEVLAMGGKANFYSIKAIQATGLPTAAPAPSPGPTPAPTPPSPPPSPSPSPGPSPAPTPPSSGWVTGKSSATEPTNANPAKGVVTVDPSFKIPMVRVTDRSDPPSGFARNDYSRRQAFNANNSRQLVYARDGFWHIFDAVTCKHVLRLAGPAADAEPIWHHSDPNKMYYIPTNGVGMRVYELDVTTNTSRVIGDLGARLKKLWPGATAAWTKSEGAPSKDGRYWCFMVDNASWGAVGIVCWDRDTDTILGSISTNDRPDHVSMSPSGEFCIVSGDSARGTVAYSRDFKTSKKLLPKSEHSDIALLPNGNDAYVSVDYQSNAGDVFFINIQTGERTVLFPSYLGGSARAFHFSGKAYDLPGFVLVSAYGEYGGAQQWMDRKITLVELKKDPVIRNVAWHRSKVPSYFFEPHASISRDGKLVAFTSAWGSEKDTDINAYQARLPAL